MRFSIVAIKVRGKCRQQVERARAVRNDPEVQWTAGRTHGAGWVRRKVEWVFRRCSSERRVRVEVDVWSADEAKKVLCLRLPHSSPFDAAAMMELYLLALPRRCTQDSTMQPLSIADWIGNVAATACQPDTGWLRVTDSEPQLPRRRGESTICGQNGPDLESPQKLL